MSDTIDDSPGLAFLLAASTRYETCLVIQLEPWRCGTTSNPMASAAGAPLPNHSSDGKLPVVIIGAGIAGLYAAHLMQKSGVKVLVLEATSKIGGRIYQVEADYDCS